MSYFGNWQNRNNCEVDQRTHNHALALKFERIQDSNKIILANLMGVFSIKSSHFGWSSERGPPRTIPAKSGLNWQEYFQRKHCFNDFLLNMPYF